MFSACQVLSVRLNGTQMVNEELKLSNFTLDWAPSHPIYIDHQKKYAISFDHGVTKSTWALSDDKSVIQKSLGILF